MGAPWAMNDFIFNFGGSEKGKEGGDIEKAILFLAAVVADWNGDPIHGENTQYANLEFVSLLEEAGAKEYGAQMMNY